MAERPGGAANFVRAMFVRTADPYAGADIGTARRGVLGLLALTTVLCLGFLPLEPVDAHLGASGWKIAGVCLLAAVAAVGLFSRREVSWDTLLTVTYGTVAGLGVLNWLADNGVSPYASLFVVWAGAAALHPPRRSALVLLAIVALLWVPYIGDGSGELAARLAAQSLLLAVVGFVLAAVLFDIRRQRVNAAAANKLARLDSLTGLGNRLSFDETIPIEIARSRREGTDLSLAIADLDDLKGINDQLGHLEGDRLLREVARALELSVRMTDRCFRWGGDEFVVILPGDDLRTAERVMGRAAQTVSRVCQGSDGRLIALSFGTAQFVEGMTIDEALSMADLSLLASKTAKRDLA